MKPKLSIALIFLSLAFTASAAESSTLQFSNAWVRATPPNAQVAGAFLSIENTSTKPDRLLSASTDVAAKVEIHEMKMDGELMQMRHLSDGLSIPAKQTVALKPGGIHLMLIAPKQPFAEGRKVAITPVFEKAGKRRLEFAVSKQAPDQAASAHMHH
jgi:copper(I)-binding protein